LLQPFDFSGRSCAIRTHDQRIKRATRKGSTSVKSITYVIRFRAKVTEIDKKSVVFTGVCHEVVTLFFIARPDRGRGRAYRGRSAVGAGIIAVRLSKLFPQSRAFCPPRVARFRVAVSTWRGMPSPICWQADETAKRPLELRSELIRSRLLPGMGETHPRRNASRRAAFDFHKKGC
jgi:hypothetical protein